MVRFTVHKTIGDYIPCWYVNDNKTDKVVMDGISYKFEADRLCEKLNELDSEINFWVSLMASVEGKFIEEGIVTYQDFKKITKNDTGDVKDE